MNDLFINDTFCSLEWNERYFISKISCQLFLLKKLYIFAGFAWKTKVSIFENDKMELSEAKLTGLWARNYVTIQKVLKFAFGPKKAIEPFEKQASGELHKQYIVKGQNRFTVIYLRYRKNASCCEHVLSPITTHVPDYCITLAHVTSPSWKGA